MPAVVIGFVALSVLRCASGGPILCRAHGSLCVSRGLSWLCVRVRVWCVHGCGTTIGIGMGTGIGIAP